MQVRGSKIWWLSHNVVVKSLPSESLCFICSTYASEHTLFSRPSRRDPRTCYIVLQRTTEGTASSQINMDQTPSIIKNYNEGQYSPFINNQVLLRIMKAKECTPSPDEDSNTWSKRRAPYQSDYIMRQMVKKLSFLTRINNHIFYDNKSVLKTVTYIHESLRCLQRILYIPRVHSVMCNIQEQRCWWVVFSNYSLCNSREQLCVIVAWLVFHWLMK